MKQQTIHATQLNIATFGAIMGVAGIIHGIGEILQGNIVPNGLMILSWPDAAFFRHTSGEPAMTVIPNMLLTGILAICFSLLYLIWATLFVQRKQSGQVLMILSVLMFLLGGGIFPPVLAFLIGYAATKLHDPHPRPGLQIKGDIWSLTFIASVLAWLLLFPGTNLLVYYFGFDNAVLTISLIGVALGSMLLAFISGFDYDKLPHKYVTRITSS